MINAPDFLCASYTSLNLAASNGHVHVVRLLIDAKAELDATDDSKYVFVKNFNENYEAYYICVELNIIYADKHQYIGV